MPRIGIVIGSTRPGRNGEQVARWVHDTATDHASGATTFELIDLADHALPLLDEPVPAAQAPGGHPHTRRWAERIGACDAYIFVTPEYNTAPPSSLTNAIDYLHGEWAYKPVAYVGYGIYGAVMAVQKLRAQAGVLRMADIAPQVALTLTEDFTNYTDFRPRPHHTPQLHALLDELLTWTQALAPLRTPTPEKVA
ncbi:NADPH-dependent FMN reductase [Actinomadura parmotrematis]|uniref:NAD(P)H-dependent oxidoreductase n=1 Tax=Actinomadura parmotrematis TaxID=2864039 RepID=A0ABS7FVI2_9ACTN|nr:NAD(P)H-dependent oxidoreductase [Actinomadura parmotrematis]MBW8484336.1 NAD(P)H-dependent oxidoreductase [Actinomadura parmotrematis]